MRVLISGYYGFGNAGDEAILEAIIKGLREKSSEIDLTVISSQPGLTAELHQVRAIGRSDLLGLISELEKADVFLSGGGTLFQDQTSNRSFLYYIGLVWLAKLFGKKVVIFGQGFGPLKSRFNRLIAKFVLKQVDLMTVRDKDSCHELQKLGLDKNKIYATADPALSLPAGDKSQGRNVLALEHVPIGKPLVGVAIRPTPMKFSEAEAFYQCLAEALDLLQQKHGFDAVFISFHCPEDLGPAHKVIERMKTKAHVIFKTCGPDEIRGLFPNLDLLIGERLHALIFAAESGVPMLGISYDPKVASFMRQIGQPCLEINKLNRLFQLAEAVLSKKKVIKNELASAAAAMKIKAKRNFGLFFERLAQ